MTHPTKLSPAGLDSDIKLLGIRTAFVLVAASSLLLCAGCTEQALPGVEAPPASAEQSDDVSGRADAGPTRRSDTRGGGSSDHNACSPHFLAHPLDDDATVINGWEYNVTYHSNSLGNPHEAIDFEAAVGTPVYAACDGRAMTSSQYANGTGYGRFIQIRCDQRAPTGEAYHLVYAHVAAGVPELPSYPMAQRRSDDYRNWYRVQTGDLVGYSGTEDTSWPHLHFEVQLDRYNGPSLDPYAIYEQTTSPQHSAEMYYPPTGSKFSSCGAAYLWKSCPPSPAGVTRGNGNTCAGVGIYRDGWREVSSPEFVAAARRWGARDKLGCPVDAGGSHYVHRIDGVELQDYYQPDANKRFSGSDGRSALAYNSAQDQVHLIRSGFWGTYKCLQHDGSAMGGASLLGAPESEEYQGPHGNTRQDFQRGYMWWDGQKIHVHFDNHVDMDLGATSGCVDAPVVENPPGPGSCRIEVVQPDASTRVERGEAVSVRWTSTVGCSDHVHVRIRRGPLGGDDDPVVATVEAPTTAMAANNDGRVDGVVLDFAPGTDYRICVGETGVMAPGGDCGDDFSITEAAENTDDDGNGASSGPTGTSAIAFDSSDPTVVQIEASAFTLHDGTPLTDLLAGDDVCAIGWAPGEPFDHQEVGVYDSDGDGWIEYPLPNIQSGSAPYSPQCSQCSNGLPFRWNLRRCRPDNLLDTAHYMDTGQAGDPRTEDFFWSGKDQSCNWTGALAVSFDGANYWASGATTSGCQ